MQNRLGTNIEHKCQTKKTCEARVQVWTKSLRLASFYKFFKHITLIILTHNIYLFHPKKILIHNLYRQRREEEVTVVVEKLLNEINMSHKHSTTAISNQIQCIKCIPAQKHNRSIQILDSKNFTGTSRFFLKQTLAALIILTPPT